MATCPSIPAPAWAGTAFLWTLCCLSWKAREYDFYTKFIELAAEVNQSMPYHVVERIGQALDARGRALRGARVLILGVAFKRDIDDARNSPAERVVELLLHAGAQVCYNDPHVPEYHVGGDVFCREKVVMTSQALSPEVLAGQDVVVIISDHRAYDYGWVVKHAPLVVDTRNVTKAVEEGRDKIVRIGVPIP